MTHVVRSLWGLLLLLAGQMALANAGETRGEDIAINGSASGIPACSSCHGMRGEGNAAVGFPRLAGLPVPYLTGQLTALADGSRRNVMMSPVAKLLSDRQRQALANYYAALPGVAKKREDGERFATGHLLATAGYPARQLPACDRCHGQQGAGVGTQFPALAGQSEVYLENQLTAWQNGERPPGPLNLMPGITSRLTQNQIKQVAGYYSRLPLPPLSSESQGVAP